MNKQAWVLAVSCALACGCATRCEPVANPTPTCHQYQAPGFNWFAIRRILLYPLENESPYPQAVPEILEALRVQMQCAGRFEVVLASPDGHVSCHDSVRVNGRFDEAELLGLADQYNADAILFVTITQYKPYAPPRVGLSLRLLSPADAALVASVDGLWDARDQTVADEARCYNSLALDGGNTVLGCELALESPALFRRYACRQAVEALVNPAPPPGSQMGTNIGIPTPPPAGGYSPQFQPAPPAPAEAPPVPVPQPAPLLPPPLPPAYPEDTAPSSQAAP